MHASGSLGRSHAPPVWLGLASAPYWDEELPSALVEAIGELGPQFDALIVDEAQDLSNDWLAALMCTLRDEEHAPVWLFIDDNQRVYDKEFEVPAEFRPHELMVNCRNTQRIHREVMKLYEGDIAPLARGPEGRDVELYLNDDPAGTITQVLEQLCGKEEVAPQDVVVLSSHALERSHVAPDVGGRWKLTKERGKSGKFVQFSSVRGFKGLEAPAVVLCELEDLDEDSKNQQLYVGISRARNHCVIVAPGA